MLRDGAAGQAAGGVAVQLRMQRARARMQTDELMVKHFEDIWRDLQWVVRSGSGDQTLKDVALDMLLKLTNLEEFKRREMMAGTSLADMQRKYASFNHPSTGIQGFPAVDFRLDFERVMQELQSSCPTVIGLIGDNSGDACCCAIDAVRFSGKASSHSRSKHAVRGRRQSTRAQTGQALGFADD
jgi:hypothetical protein